ncbi:MAG: glycosyltransferase family 39 protein [Planctomycetota bacterium]
MASSTSSLAADAERARSSRWYVEPEFALLVLLALSLYFARLTTLTLRGEESRRAQVAQEMLQNGDWIIPRQQGELFPSRPPLGSWVMAAAAVVRGNLDLAAVRIPSALATVLTVILVYAYSRLFLTRVGAFAAGAAYASMFEVLHLGRLGESEAVFTLLLATALLVWHAGYHQGWQSSRYWITGYAFAGLATLTKGPQGFIYFFAAVAAFLILRRDWRTLFSPSHGGGLVTFAIVYGLWQVPFFLQLGIPGIEAYLSFEMSQRFSDRTVATVLGHLAVFPWNMVGSLLPGSLCLLAFARPSVRRNLGSAGPAVWFLVAAIAITFPTVWFPPGGRTRYFMPMYPLFAVLIGVAIERWNATRGENRWSNRRLLGTVFAAACLTGAIYIGPVINNRAKVSVQIEPEVAAVKEMLPEGEPFVSFGILHHKFTFVYRDLIPPLPWPQASDDLPNEITYFCFHKYDDLPIQLPFDWEPIAVVNCDRNRSEKPFDRVIVGRRLKAGEVASRPSSSDGQRN